MPNPNDQFTKYSRDEKVLFITTFYSEMIKKTNNPEYISKFQSKIQEVKWYEQNEDNIQELTNLYDRILQAQERTKQNKTQQEHQKMEQSLEKIKQLQNNEFDEDADAFLAEQLAKI